MYIDELEGTNDGLASRFVYKKELFENSLIVSASEWLRKQQNYVFRK